MDLVMFLIIIMTLCASTFICIGVMKYAEKKWLSIIAGFITNTLILLVMTVALYKLNSELYHKNTTGIFNSLGIFVLVFFIPINTVINYYVLSITKIKRR